MKAKDEAIKNDYNNTYKDLRNRIVNLWRQSKNDYNSQLKSIDKLVCTEQKKIAYHFDAYFSTIADSNHDFFIRPTNEKEIIQVIKEFNVNKSNGPNSIPTKILHLIKGLMLDPLSHVISLSFSKGIYFK